MAIQKDFDTNFGITANYHKISKIEFLCKEQVIEFTVAIYASQAAKEADARPLWHEYLRVPFASFNSDPRQAFYPILEQYSNSYLKGGSAIVNDVLDIPNALVLKESATTLVAAP